MEKYLKVDFHVLSLNQSNEIVKVIILIALYN